MSPDEALRICRLAKALSPAQAVDEYTPEAWSLVLRDTRYADAEQALVDLGGEREWIHVSHIKARVKHIRNERVRAFGTMPEPPPAIGQDPERYHHWYAKTLRAIRDGELTRDTCDAPVLDSKPTPEQRAALRELVAEAKRGLSHINGEPEDATPTTHPAPTGATDDDTDRNKTEETEEDA